MTDTLTTDPDRATPTGEAERKRKDEWLALLLLVTAGDVDAAKQAYIDHAPRSLRGLVTGDGFTWDAQRQVYVRDATGHAVSSRDVKRASLLLSLAVAHQLEDEAAYVADGTTPIDLWQGNAADTVKDAALAQAALASGGFDLLTPALLAVMVGTAEKPPGLKFNLSKLYDFAKTIEASKVSPGTKKAIVNRAGLYGAASNGIYEEVRRSSHTEARDGKGRRLYLKERNILGESDHCTDSEDAPGCPEETARGWVDIGTLSAPGSRTCRANCKCFMEYSLAGHLPQTPRA